MRIFTNHGTGIQETQTWIHTTMHQQLPQLTVQYQEKVIRVFWYIIPTRYTSQSSFYLILAINNSGVTITHLQEHKTTASTPSDNHYTVMLSAAIVENFQLFHNSSRQQYGVMDTRCCRCTCFVLLKMGDSDTRNM
jgi:hypothetical protein